MAKWQTFKSNNPDIVESIYTRDKYLCHYCGKKVTSLHQIFRLMEEKQESLLAQARANEITWDEYAVLSDSWKIRKDIESSINMATIDHIIPQSKGGTNDLENLTTCCRNCNSKKKDREEIPQKENGYTPIANKILENLARINLSSYETRILMFVFRKTYGFGKKTDYISLDQFASACNLDKRLIARTIKKLVDRNLIYRDDNYRRRYNFQKDSSIWDLSSIKMKPKVIKRDDVSHPNRRKVSSIEIHTKETTKENIQKIVGELNSPTPSEKTKSFFEGVQDLVNFQKATTDEDRTRHQTDKMIAVQSFLRELAQMYPDANKNLVWSQIRRFCDYWTELNGTGKKQRWEMEKTFQVERRLSTWLSRTDQFKNRIEKPKNNNYSPNKIY